MLESENGRLRKCPSCDGEGQEWDDQMQEFTIDCANCVGEGVICGVCYSDVSTCAGEGACWEYDEEELFEYEPEDKE